MSVVLRRVLAPALPLLCLLLVACPSPADLEVDVAVLDFGDLAVGSSLALPISITNVGGFKATLSFAIDPPGVFAMDIGGAIEVLPAGTRVLYVRADPTEVGLAAGTVTLLWNAADSLEIPLRVTGVDAGAEDSDGDGYSVDDDCDDGNPDIHPGAVETCDAVDNDCDEDVDEGFDGDSDGATTCGPDGLPGTADDDCDDDDPTVSPSSTEACDGIDNDCDAEIDEGFDEDEDLVTTCDGDCDDDDPEVFPGNTEVCDGLDNDCSGVADSGFPDLDNDGASTCVDCDDDDPTLFPGNTEVCDGADNDCDCGGDSNFDGTVCGPGDDGVDENGVDADNDGFGCLDCDDQAPLVFPGAAEICDAVDNNCEGTVDEGFDGDADLVTSCGPDGVVGSVDDDCDDTNINAYPGAPEACGGAVDLDCDGSAPAPCTGLDCADILASNPSSPDGVYTVDPTSNGVGFDVWCDMTTASGGWTMVMRVTDDGTANAALAAAGSYQAVHDNFVPAVGYDPGAGTPVRVPAQYWDDFAGGGELMVRHELLKADGSTCAPLLFSLPGNLNVPPVAAGLNITFARTAADPHDLVNGTQAGNTPVLQTTDRYTVAPGCVPTNGAAPWFMGTCNGGLTPAQGAGYWSAAAPRSVVYFDRVTVGTDLNGTDFAAACGGSPMLNPPAAALGQPTAWYTDAVLEYYFR